MVQSQDIVIKGIVTDSETETALYKVKISLTVNNEEFKTSSNTSGEFLIPYNPKEKSSIIFSKESYAGVVIQPKIKKKDIVDGVYLFNVQMTRGEQLPIVNITAKNKPVKVYGSKKHNLADFDFIGDSLLLLTYDKNPNKERKILITDKDRTVLDSLKIPKSAGKISGFERNFTKDILLNTENYLFEVKTEKNIELINVDRKSYDDNVRPIVDTINNKVYLSTWFDKFPAFAYYEYGIVDSSYQMIREIADDFMLELCRAEYKYLSGRSKLLYYRQELKLGIDKEILACIDSYDQGLYYDPLYAPMFIIQDTMLIFDHCDNLLCRYDMNRNPIDSMKIDYHQPGKKINRTFTESVIKDTNSNKIYAVYQHQGGTAYLKEIDTNTGKIAKEHQLKYPYPNGIKVKDGYAYYIYRPFESLQKKYLYRELLQ